MWVDTQTSVDLCQYAGVEKWLSVTCRMKQNVYIFRCFGVKWILLCFGIKRNFIFICFGIKRNFVQPRILNRKKCNANRLCSNSQEAHVNLLSIASVYRSFHNFQVQTISFQTSGPHQYCVKQKSMKPAYETICIRKIAQFFEQSFGVS